MNSLFLNHVKPDAPLMLASVATLHEAQLALQGGADVIDIKDATQGSLGAASLNDSADITSALRGKTVLSATVGDLPMEPAVLAQACQARAALGVSYVKLGLMPAVQRIACIHALAATALPGAVKKVAVLFADREHPSPSLITQLAQAGFAGVVLDTFDKRGSLLSCVAQWQDAHALQQCIEHTQDSGMFIGLAGSLRVEDIATLSALRPTLLGFRGALCVQASRIAQLELARVAQVRAAMNAACALTTRQEAFV
jgi:(5-formylfuran-3-yl)methyl phosphate synthase